VWPRRRWWRRRSALGIIFVLMVAAIGVGIAAKNRGGSTTGVQYAGH